MASREPIRWVCAAPWLARVVSVPARGNGVLLSVLVLGIAMSRSCFQSMGQKSLVQVRGVHLCSGIALFNLASKFLWCWRHWPHKGAPVPHGLSCRVTLVIGFLSLRPQAGICQSWSRLVSKLSCRSRAKGGNSLLSHLRPVMERAQGVTGSLRSPFRGPRFTRLIAGVSHLLDPLLTRDPNMSDLRPIPL